MLTKRDMTLPDIINGEGEKWAAIRIVNAQEKALTGLKIQCTLENGESATLTTDDVMPMMVRKVKFRIPGATSSKTVSYTHLDVYKRQVRHFSVTLRVLYLSIPFRWR